MLRPCKFRPFEKAILQVIALFILVASLFIGIRAVEHADWRFALASAGGFALATIYLLAARRGKPL
jgi:hypothetical protein